MSTVDYDINEYRRRYFRNHPEKRLQYRINEAVALLVRTFGAEGAKALIDAKDGHVAAAQAPGRGDA